MGGVRRLTVLKQFEPFGLTVEASDNGDGKPLEGDYKYSLFDSQLIRSNEDIISASCNDCDHELFIRGKHLVWSSGSQVLKRYSAPSTIIKASWCHMGSISEPLLCILHLDSLITYTSSGDMVSIPTPPGTASIWPVPFGLLLERAADRNYLPINASSPGQSLSATRETGRVSRESSLTPFNSHSPPNFRWPAHDHRVISSHYILKDTLEEPQALLVEERGKTLAINDPHEQILWTSEIVPYIVSYHKGNMRHSLWYLKTVNYNMETPSTFTVHNMVPVGEQAKGLCLQRIWQDRGFQPVANQVFFATDEDGVPLICFMLKDKKCLLSLRLHLREREQDIITESTDISWRIPAADAAPVVVTRPKLKRQGMHQYDLLILAPDGDLFLYVGRHCLCKFILPQSVLNVPNTTVSHFNQHMKDVVQEDGNKFDIAGLSDAVRGRINCTTASGEVLRCTLRAEPVSLVMEDCISALSEGLSPSVFLFFLKSLWGQDCHLSFSDTDFEVDYEWQIFSRLIMDWIRNVNCAYPVQVEAKTMSAWNFLLCSKMHMNYVNNPRLTGISLPPVSGLKISCQSGNSTAKPSPDNISYYEKGLVEVLVTLHAVYEDYKLDILRKQDLHQLASLLSRIAACLGEANYVDYYVRDFPGLSPLFPVLGNTSNLKSPPNLLQWLQNRLKYGCCSKDREGLPSLLYKEGITAVEWSRKVVAFYSLLLGSERTGKYLVSGVSFNVATGTVNTPEQWTVLSMVAEGFGLPQLDRLPCGVALPLRHALDRCRESVPVDWPAAAYVLVGREDLALTAIGRSTAERSAHKVQSVSNYLNLISMSAPYTLHLHPLIVPSSTTDLEATVVSGKQRVDSTAESVVDGMEHMFNPTTQLRFGRDLRLSEVRRLLCTATPVVIPAVHGAVDEDHQAYLMHLTQRTTAQPFGRGAFTLATTWTLLTEALTFPALEVCGRVPSMRNMIVHLSNPNGNIGDIISWPEFHNGVAAGLRIAPHQARMSRTWITYNKPLEPNYSHAGFLMALGLHGHLRILARSDIYEYLTQTHEATMIGTMLGLAASHKGTMHPTISKMLYVHIPSRHPPSFPELELPTHVQSAAILAVGLLYQESTHPMTMKILLDEIGRRSGGDNVLERERYAIAAGLALGLVTLGRGNDASGFAETLVNRLFQYISGSIEPHNESFSMEYSVEMPSTGQVMDGSFINLDVTAPAATVALALMFLKSDCEDVASRLSVPDTHYGLQFVRPDFILLRVIARNMILWERINPSETWVQNQIPDIMKEGVRIMAENSDDIPGNVDMEAIIQSFTNIVCGACLSIGLRYAGTANADAQELLYSYSIYFLNEIKPVAASNIARHPKGLSKYVDRATLEACLSVIILSLSLVMAGTGHLGTFKLLRYLHSRIDLHGHTKYGNHMAVQLIGNAVERAKAFVEEQKEEWTKFGCTILSDGWTDGKSRTIINFLACCNDNVVFLKSIDASNKVKNAETLALMLENMVLEIGIENVVQIITDNAAAYVSTGKLLQQRHPTLSWTPCAAHLLDLLLEDMGKLEWVTPIVEDARRVTKYIYNHPWVLSLMREHTDGKEIVKAAVTRFATIFLTLQSILDNLASLKQMFGSKKWLASTFSKKSEGENVVRIVFEKYFEDKADEIVKVSMAIGFLFLGGGRCTFSTNKGAIAALLISLYPVFPTKPNDNNTHLQAFRHLYVLATEARYVQAVDVDTGRDVYVPLEITIRETTNHLESTYCQVTPCTLPERSILKRVQVCGPRYWPQDIQLCPTDDPWWGPVDKDDPFSGGVLYVKRKVGVCSYADDPTGCQSLLSRVMHKVSDRSKGLSTGTSIGKSCGSPLSKVDQLVSTFSADPSLQAFAQLCCDVTWKNRTENEFQEFCVQVLFECVSKDRPALLQTYLYLFTTVSSLAEYASSQGVMCNNTLALSNLQVAVAYGGALLSGKLQNASGELIQSSFLAALAKRVEDILNYCHWLRMDGDNRYIDLVDYLLNGKWPSLVESNKNRFQPGMILAIYLRWYDMPPPPVVNLAMKRLTESLPRSLASSKNHPRMPFLASMLPGTNVRALAHIDECYH